MRRGFTLIELLVVIAIIAILSVVVILSLNPAELLRQSRDSGRLSDLATINSALGLYTTDQAGVTGYSLGNASSVYVSLSDSSSTCGSRALPALPSGYTYACAASTTFRNIKNQGWIPVNFGGMTAGSPLGQLPVDPVNQTSTGLYYTYQTDGQKYEVSTIFESTKYQTNAINDGGVMPSVYEVGSSMNLSYASGYSCKDILMRNPSSASGIYWIRPDSSPAIETYCDMTTAGGGWTLIGMEFSYSAQDLWTTYGDVAANGASIYNLVTATGSNYFYAQKVLGNKVPVTELLVGKLNSANINDRSTTSLQFFLPSGQSWPPNARKGATNTNNNGWCSSWYYGSSTRAEILWLDEASNCGDGGGQSGYAPRRMYLNGSQLPWNGSADTGTGTGNNFGYVFGR